MFCVHTASSPHPSKGNWEQEAGGSGNNVRRAGSGRGPLTFKFLYHFKVKQFVYNFKVKQRNSLYSGNKKRVVWEQCKEDRVKMWAIYFLFLYHLPLFFLFLYNLNNVTHYIPSGNWEQEAGGLGTM